jgi:hypothetical protein
MSRISRLAYVFWRTPPAARLWTGVLAGVLISAASIAAALLIKEETNSLVVAIVFIMAVGTAIILPAVLAPFALVSDLLRLSLLDASLMGDLPWHPDLTLMSVELPDRIREGQENRSATIKLRYKPFVTAYRGEIQGTARLIMDPPLFEFDAVDFILSPAKQTCVMSFGIPKSAFDPCAWATAASDTIGEGDTLIKCEFYLEITSQWELRLFDDPAERRVRLGIGALTAEAVGAKKWIERAINLQILTTLASDVNFNPVTYSPDQAVATNLAFRTARWLDRLKVNEPNYQLQFDVAARLLAREICLAGGSIRPPEAIPAAIGQHHPAGKTPSKADESRADSHQAIADAYASERNPPEMIQRLEDEVKNVLSQLTPVRTLLLEHAGLDHSPPNETYRLQVQDLGGDTDEQPSETNLRLASILGFQALPARLCLYSVAAGGGNNRYANRAVPIEDVLDGAQAKLLQFESAQSAFPKSADVPPGGRPDPPEDDADEASYSSQPVLAGPSQAREDQPKNSDPDRFPKSAGDSGDPLKEIRSALDSLVFMVRQSRAVVRGFYVRASREIDSHWVDLDRLSHWIRDENESARVGQIVETAIQLLSRATASTQYTIVNCCQSDTDMSDRRFMPLIGWTSENVRTVAAVRHNGSWSVPDIVGDAYIISALSNDWKGYDQLAHDVGHRGGVVVHIPILGTMKPRLTFNYDGPGAVGYQVLPLLVWNSTDERYTSSERSRIFSYVWSSAARASLSHQTTASGKDSSIQAPES